MRSFDPLKKAAFLAEMRGIEGRHVTKALSTMTRGIDWSGCSKTHMAECYADLSPARNDSFHRNVHLIDLSVLKTRALGRANNQPRWWLL